MIDNDGLGLAMSATLGMSFRCLLHHLSSDEFCWMRCARCLHSLSPIIMRRVSNIVYNNKCNDQAVSES